MMNDIINEAKTLEAEITFSKEDARTSYKTMAKDFIPGILTTTFRSSPRPSSSPSLRISSRASCTTTTSSATS